MRRHRVTYFHSENLLLAGRVAPAGAYRDVESGRVVFLEAEGNLPASLDGRVACYLPLRTPERAVSATILTGQALVNRTDRPEVGAAL